MVKYAQLQENEQKETKNSIVETTSLMLEKWVTYMKRCPVVGPTLNKLPAAVFPMINRVDICRTWI